MTITSTINSALSLFTIINEKIESNNTKIPMLSAILPISGFTLGHLYVGLQKIFKYFSLS